MFDELMRSEEKSFEEILINLLDEENVDMKTDIPAPLNLTKLEVFGKLLGTQELKKCESLINHFCYRFRVNRVSFKRQSRQEIIQALTEGIKREQTVGEKLVTPVTSREG